MPALILEGSRKLVLVDDPDAPDCRRLPHAIPIRAASTSSCRSAQQPVELPGSVHVDTGKQAAWLCLGQSCLPPINDPQRASVAENKAASGSSKVD